MAPLRGSEFRSPTARKHPFNFRFIALAASATTPDWLEVDTAKLTGKVTRIPSVEEIAPIVNVQLIVELYSR